MNHGKKEGKETAMKSAIAFIVVFAACAGQASRIESGSSSADGAFAKYRTFGFRPVSQPDEPFEVSARSFEAERRMRPLVEAELLRRGYAESSGQVRPDFLVSFGLGYAQVPTTSQPGGSLATVVVEKGRIAVDAFDASNGLQVWHGSGEAEVDPKKIDDSLLEAAVQQVLAPFPTRSAASPPAQ
jgi:hypothetical protein